MVFQSTFDSRVNRLQHASQIASYVVVPHAKNFKSKTAQNAITVRIIRCCVRVLSAIDLDDQSHIKTYEIHDEIGQRVLSSKLHTKNLPRTKMTPQYALHIRSHARIDSKRAALTSGWLIRVTHRPPAWTQFLLQTAVGTIAFCNDTGM